MSLPKWNEENLIAEGKKYTRKDEFHKNSGGAYNAAKRLGILDKVCAHMPKNMLSVQTPHNKRWTEETLTVEAKKYKNRYELKKNNPSAFNSAKQQNLLNCLYPTKEKFRNKSYSLQEISDIARKYKSRSELKNNNPYIYRKLLSMDNKDDVLSHTLNFKPIAHNKKWDYESIAKEALKYKTRTEFLTHASGAYDAALNYKIVDDVCSHMEEVIHNWSEQEIRDSASKYDKRSEFQNNQNKAYSSAQRKNILDEVCAHMKRSANISNAEQVLFDSLKAHFPKIQKLRDRKVNIPNKPHIKGFDIDMYIPELRKGIEFDGRYWHSVEGLKRSREHWPEEDLSNYSKLKDNHFKQKGIAIHHINEQDWMNNKEECLKKCFEFLGISND